MPANPDPEWRIFSVRLKASIVAQLERQASKEVSNRTAVIAKAVEYYLREKGGDE